MKAVKNDAAKAAAWWRNPALPVVAYVVSRIAYKIITGHDAPE